MTSDGTFPVGVITVQTDQVLMTGEDNLLALVEDKLEPLGGAVCQAVQVKPQLDLIVEQLALMADRLNPAFIFTLGGTGLHYQDVTPDATQQVIHRPAPGIAEVLRAQVGQRVPEFALTRGTSGLRGWTLIVNLPGDLQELELCLHTLEAIMPAAVKQLERPDTLVTLRQMRLL